jgi:hypothetical protein
MTDDSFDSTDDPAVVIAAERAVWEGWRNRDVDAIAAHTAVDYLAVDAEGVFDWPSVTDTVNGSSLVAYSFGEVTTQRIAADVIALLFTVDAQLGPRPPLRSARVSVVSVWAKRSSRWLSVLRHEVVIEGPLYSDRFLQEDDMFTIERNPGCSFCRRGATVVNKLVAGPRMLLIGPRVHICDQCIGVAQQIVTQSPEAGPQHDR